MPHFDEEQAFSYLKKRELEKKEQNEKLRLNCLEKCKTYLKDKFDHTDIEIYLVGSIIKPYLFTSKSDIDIVIFNFQGERFGLWAEFEAALKWPVELILFETCPFQEEVKKNGLKIV